MALNLLEEIEDAPEDVGTNKALSTGEIKFDPAGGEGGIPSLTVGGGSGESTLEGVLPGTAAIKKQTEEVEVIDPSVPRDRFGKPLPTLEQGIDPVTGKVTLTAAPQKEKKEGLAGKIEDVTAVGTMAILESFGVPTRALGAAVKDVNPFASKEDKGKSFDEVFKDPDSGIFKEARRIVRDSDWFGAVKFILEMGISIPEDPLALVGGLASGLKAGARGFTARKAARKETTDILPASLEPAGQADILKPSGKVKLEFTQSEREFIETGTVSAKTSKKEKSAVKLAPEKKTELIARRKENITSNMNQIRKDHGLTDTNEGGTLFAKFGRDVDKAVGLFRKETNELYKRVNKEADPTVLGDETRVAINDAFRRAGIVDAKKFNEVEIAGIIQEVTKKGDLEFATGKGGKLIPIERGTGRELTKAALEKESGGNVLTASDLGLKKESFTKVKGIQKTLNNPNRTLLNLRMNRRTLDDIISESKRKGSNTDAAVLLKLREGLTEGIRTQIDGVMGDPALTREWMLADDFVSNNASGVKAAAKLMFDKNNNPRSATAIIQEFAKVPTRKKGAVIESMMDFFDKPAMQNLRNLYFNDIIEKASTNGKFTGQKLRNVINAQPEMVFNKVFSKKMKEDMSDLLGDAISDDLAKEVTNAKLNKFSASDKRSFFKTMLSNPAYRMAGVMMGLTKFTVKKLTLFGAAQMLLGITERRALRSAESFFRGTSGPSLTELTFKSLKEGAKESLRPRAHVVPMVVQRNLNEQDPKTKTKQAGGLNLLEGL